MCLLELEKGAELSRLMGLPVREEIVRMKYIPEEKVEAFDDIEKRMKQEIETLVKDGSSNEVRLKDA